MALRKSGTKVSFQRPDGRPPNQLRPIRFQRNPAPFALGSVLVSAGRTRVICGVSVEEGVPRWMREQELSGGWITAEYSLLPYSTEQRTRREATTGRVGGRTHEIQRMIGRCLRAVTDLEALGPRTVWVDCDVLAADGGTRTAAITGAYVAFRLAVRSMLRRGVLEQDPVNCALAAVSVGIVQGVPLLDLCYEEDAQAEVDMNVVLDSRGRIIEVQGTGERMPFSRRQLTQLLNLAQSGIEEILRRQEHFLGEAAS